MQRRLDIASLARTYEPGQRSPYRNEPIIGLIRQGTRESWSLDCDPPPPLMIAISRAINIVAMKTRHRVGDVLIVGTEIWNEIQQNPDNLHEFTNRHFKDVRLLHDPEMKPTKGVAMLLDPKLVLDSMVGISVEYRPNYVLPKV